MPNTDNKKVNREEAMAALMRLSGVPADHQKVGAYVEYLEGLLQRQTTLAKEISVILPHDSESDCG